MDDESGTARHSAGCRFRPIANGVADIPQMSSEEDPRLSCCTHRCWQLLVASMLELEPVQRLPVSSPTYASFTR